jgi:hypothetical protein
MSPLKDFSRRDALFIGALLMIAVLAWINFRNDSKKNKARHTFSFGKVIKIEGGEGKHLIASDFFWTEVQEGESLGTNDSFMTGPNTNAEIQIGSNRIILKPNTLIKLIKEDVIRFNDGQILVLGSDVKIKTNSAVHKVSGEVLLVTNSEKDKVTVAKGEHAIIPEKEFVVETKYIPPPPLAANYFMEATWLKKGGLPEKVFFLGETINLAGWINKVQGSNLLSGKVYIEGREIDAQFFMPLLSFEQEFKISNDRFLINKRRLNAILIVNGRSYEAGQEQHIQLKAKKNHISLSHTYQNREFHYYVDEAAEEIKVQKKDYQLTKAVLELPKALISFLSKDDSVEEEEEEEPKGTIRLEWESGLKDNQVFVIKIKNSLGETILEDFAEERFLLWTPPSPGNYLLDVSIKSTATEKILRSTSTEITVKQPPPDLKERIISRRTILAAGSSFIHSETKKENQVVNAKGVGPVSLRLKADINSFAVQIEGTLFVANNSSLKKDKFFNSKLQLSYEKGNLIPLIAYQNANLFVPSSDKIEVLNYRIFNAGLGYNVRIKKIQLMPFYTYNLASISGYQAGLELSTPLPVALPLTLITRGELNDLRDQSLKNRYTQLTLLLGMFF